MRSKIVELARQHIGERYVLGSHVPYDNPGHTGPWDCAEFATWLVYQSHGMLLGLRPRSLTRGDAYTGFWMDDADRFGLRISIAQALSTPGAMLCRSGLSGRIGHIALCVGDGQNVVEAASRDLGVVEQSGLRRPWDTGIRIPAPDEFPELSPAGAAVGGPLVLRAADHPVADPRVARLQEALAAAGFAPGSPAGLFDSATERAVANYQEANGLIVDGIVGPQTGIKLGLPFWTTNADVDAMPPATRAVHPKYGVVFESLVPGGFFSADPDNLKIKRSIRSNNPGALNFAVWQQQIPGFVAKTIADKAGNVTSIYRTPEHGTAAWYNLLTKRYGYGMNGQLRIGDLATRYAGADSEAAKQVQDYLAGWARFSGGALGKDDIVSLADQQDVLVLAKAMFAHEIGTPSPLKDEQITFGVEAWRSGSLPA